MTLPPSQTVCGSHGANPIGESQLNLYCCASTAKPEPDGPYHGAMYRLKFVRSSKIEINPPWESAHTRCGSAGSGIAHMPSPPVTIFHIEFRMPSLLKLLDGPQNELLSCSGAQTWYGLL